MSPNLRKTLIRASPFSCAPVSIQRTQPPLTSTTSTSSTTSWTAGCGVGYPKALLERRHERVGDRASRVRLGHDDLEIALGAGRVVARARDRFHGELRLSRHIRIGPAADLHRASEVGDVPGAPK